MGSGNWPLWPHEPEAKKLTEAADIVSKVLEDSWDWENDQTDNASYDGAHREMLYLAVRLIRERVKRKEKEPIFVVFDGPPDHHAPGFVEVENEQGEGQAPYQTGADWKEREDGNWSLGPFWRKNDHG